MGKPFAKELQQLEGTYKWARGANIGKLERIVTNSFWSPLQSVGSGGSYSLAELHAGLHRQYTQQIAQANTPMEIIENLPSTPNSSLCFLSAGGNNIDIVRAFKHSVILEPRYLFGLVGSKANKLLNMSCKYHYAKILDFPLPSGRDGFLATNSLIAFSTILSRAYEASTSTVGTFPPSLESLLRDTICEFDGMEALRRHTHDLWRQEKLHILYSPYLKSCAIDIESKFIEAGLGSVHISDFRNFAHGRHHWFSKNERDCAILALIIQRDQDLGRKTLGLLPQIIPQYTLVLQPSDHRSLITGMLLSIYFSHWKGIERNIDPGRPRVPLYGSKIYNLSSKSGFRTSMPRTEAAINRKIIAGSYSSTQELLKAQKVYISKLCRQKFGAVVLDYDGTVLGPNHRKSPPEGKVLNELERLLQSGVKIGFATGRGKSIREVLQYVIDRKFWKQIVIGYYNGSEIGLLENNQVPDRTAATKEVLNEVHMLLSQDPAINSLDLKFTLRQSQLTLESNALVSISDLWETVNAHLGALAFSVKITKSGHSIDILSPNVTKLDVVHEIQSELREDQRVLVVGDRGKWPGNDFELLSHPYSLSVDEVSGSNLTCWNLCPAGFRGPQGTLYYLQKAKISKREFTLALG